MSGWGFGPYVSVGERRRLAEQEMARRRKAGHDVKPVRIEGRKIAHTFWGQAWCEHIEALGDYENRLPRGKRYARNGSVADLQISPGLVEAVVAGSSLYDVKLTIAPLPQKRWVAIRKGCAGEVSSLVELLQGHVSDGVMREVTNASDGLFPRSSEIQLSCSCPDWAEMCKHVAAVLYGVAARLDREPQMLFSLRGVDPSEMIDDAIEHGVAAPTASTSQTLDTSDLSSVFGVEIDFDSFSSTASPATSTERPKPSPAGRSSTTKAKAKAKTCSPANLRLERLFALIAAVPSITPSQIRRQLDLQEFIVTAAVEQLLDAELIMADRTGHGFVITLQS